MTWLELAQATRGVSEHPSSISNFHSCSPSRATMVRTSVDVCFDIRLEVRAFMSLISAERRKEEIAQEEGHGDGDDQSWEVGYAFEWKTNIKSIQ